MHTHVTPIDPVETPHRRWKCERCGMEGTLFAIMAEDCEGEPLTEDEFLGVIDGLHTK